MGAKAKRHCRILLSSNSEVTKNCRAKEVLGVDELEAVADRGYYSSEEILAGPRM
jgi:hypothetical protein